MDGWLRFFRHSAIFISSSSGIDLAWDSEKKCFDEYQNREGICLRAWVAAHTQLSAHQIRTVLSHHLCPSTLTSTYIWSQGIRKTKKFPEDSQPRSVHTTEYTERDSISSNYLPGFLAKRPKESHHILLPQTQLLNDLHLGITASHLITLLCLGKCHFFPSWILAEMASRFFQF